MSLKISNSSRFHIHVRKTFQEEAKAVNKKLAAKLANKWKAPYSATCGFINARISIAIIRATHLCLRGSRIPFRNMSSKWCQWDDGAGLLLPH